MARKPTSRDGGDDQSVGVSSYDQMLLNALQRGDESLETGRYIVTYREDAADQGGEFLKSLGLRTADARDFDEQAVSAEDVGDADALIFPEIGAAVISAEAAAERELGAATLESADTAPVESIEPEYFVFADTTADYLRGFRRAVETLSSDLGPSTGSFLLQDELEVDAQVIGATWGLAACRVPQTMRSGAGIRVAVLDTGMALNHPDFQGRHFVTQTFVGQPVQDLHSHGTHCIGTACGPRAPAGPIPRYGIGFHSHIFVGKVLSNSGSGGTASVLGGMNWAIARGCEVISMSLGSNSPPQAAYTAAGRAALARGCLIIAAAGNRGPTVPTGAPANSPTIMAVASLDNNLAPSIFSCSGKIDIAGPGRDVFSSVPMPRRYAIFSGTSMATPHVAGCAALLAQGNQGLRGQALWNKLVSTARALPFPAARVGAGLVQAPS
ncbi:MAG: S8 family serine peptidase [Pseudomonadota bacterium]|nr:S8 family serine peptidase [Pseudomonadota bacterium]